MLLKVFLQSVYLFSTLVRRWVLFRSWFWRLLFRKSVQINRYFYTTFEWIEPKRHENFKRFQTFFLAQFRTEKRTTCRVFDSLELA